MSKKSEIYLGKLGKVFGPFSQSEIDEFQKSGKITQFTWIWSHAKSEWTPLDAPPPPLTETLETTTSAAPEVKNTKKGSTPIREKFQKNNLEVICHNFKVVLSGKLEQVTETGCQLVSNENSTSPSLPNETQVLLNLLEPKSGKTINVKAKVLKIMRDSSRGWVYQMRWGRTPSFV